MLPEFIYVFIYFYFVGLFLSLALSIRNRSHAYILALQSFGFWRTWWMLFHRHAVRTEFVIYGFIIAKRNGITFITTKRIIFYNLTGIMSLRLVIFFKFFFALKVNIYLQTMSITRVFSPVFLCTADLTASLIMHAQFPNYMHNGTDVYTSACNLSLNANLNTIHQSCWWPMLILVLL